MASRRRHSAPEHTLAVATRLITGARRQLGDTPHSLGELSHERLRETAWQLVGLTGELAELTTALALRLDEHGRTRLLRTHDGHDPTADLARAARQLTELRQALDRAETAGRDYHACLSRLVVDADPTLPPPRQPQRTPRRRTR